MDISYFKGLNLGVDGDSITAGNLAIPDIFIFSMETNDLKENLGLERSDLINDSNISLTEADLYTSAGAMRWCINAIRNAFPKVKLVILTPIQSADTKHNEKLRLQIDKIIQPIAQATDCILINCYDCCPIHAAEEHEGLPGTNLSDGLHPNEKGQKVHGDYVSEALITAFQ